MRRAKPDAERVFHALGDVTRRSMVQRISRGPISVSQLAAPLGVTLAAVVQHLKILEESGLVRTEKEGRVRTCRMDAAGLTVAEEWIGRIRTTWERRLDKLGELLASEDE